MSKKMGIVIVAAVYLAFILTGLVMVTATAIAEPVDFITAQSKAEMKLFANSAEDKKAALAYTPASTAISYAEAMTDELSPDDVQTFIDSIQPAIHRFSERIYVEKMEPATYGTAGRLIIPSLGINVACYYSDFDYCQVVTDMEDSAAYLTCDGTDFIADHRNQGFDGLYNAVAGTMAYLKYADGTIKELVCQEVCSNGYSDDYDIYDSSNCMSYYRGYPLFMYTCNPTGWPSITITYWSWVAEE